MANRQRLYPSLNDLWSDVDEEGTGESEGGLPDRRDLYSSGERYTEGGPSYERSSPRLPQDIVGSAADYQKGHSQQHHNSSCSRERRQPTPRHYRLLHRNRDFPDSSDLFEKPREEAEPSLSGRSKAALSSLASLAVSLGSGAWKLALRGVAWSVEASLWQKALLTIILGLLCSMVFTAVRDQWSSTAKDNYLPCPSSTEASLPPCIPDSDVRIAKLAALKMREILSERAVQYICTANDIPTLSLSLGDLRKRKELKDVSRKDIRNVFYLILVNTHWNIRWMDKDNQTVSNWRHSPHDSDVLASLSPSLPLKCRALLSFASLWHFIQWILLALMSLVAVYAVVTLYQRRKRRQESAIFALVTRITDVMKYHYKKSSSKKDLLPYLAIIHVRDMLIPPSERKAKEKLWNAAVHWIASHESRMRVETRRIAGEDFEVWRWIQEDPPPTEIPVSSQQSSIPGRNQGNWYGSVFDHYPPEITTKVAPPTGTPSLCIRLKNMFEPVRKMAETQCRELESAVLERCHPHGPVIHVWVDKKSPVGCVYLKMGSLKSAMGAYNALHGGWYKGKLVTAKYIPEAKYHKWFPVAMNAKTPLSRS